MEVVVGGNGLGYEDGRRKSEGPGGSSSRTLIPGDENDRAFSEAGQAKKSRGRREPGIQNQSGRGSKEILWAESCVASMSRIRFQAGK